MGFVGFVARPRSNIGIKRVPFLVLRGITEPQPEKKKSKTKKTGNEGLSPGPRRGVWGLGFRVQGLRLSNIGAPYLGFRVGV